MRDAVETIRRFDLSIPEAALLREARLLDCERLADVPGGILRPLLSARDRLRARAQPRAAVRRLDLASPDAAFLRAPACLAKSRAAARTVALFAATLGDAPERLLAEARGEPLAQFLIHAAANALVEHVMDQVEERLRVRARDEGGSLTRRVSPGYGDLPLAAQGEFARLLEFASLGVEVTASHLLVPGKSVTALAFFSEGG